MNLRPLPLFEFVRLIDLCEEGQTRLCILLGSPADRTGLREELGLQTGRDLDLIDARDTTPNTLMERLRTSKAPVVMVSGLEGWSNGSFAALDANRSRLETGTFVILAADPPTAARLLDQAPNLRSSIGTSVFVLAPDPSLMTSEEVAERLGQLRETYGISDEDVVEHAKQGILPPEPHFIEWLVLLGRGDLVR